MKILLAASFLLICPKVVVAANNELFSEVYDQNGELMYAAQPDVGESMGKCPGGVGDMIYDGLDEKGDAKSHCECPNDSMVTCYAKVPGEEACEIVACGSSGGGGDGGSTDPGGGGGGGDGCGASNWEDVGDSLQCAACGGYWRPSNALPCYGGWATTAGGMATVVSNAWIGTKWGFKGSPAGAIAWGITGIVTGLTISILTCDYSCQEGSGI